VRKHKDLFGVTFRRIASGRIQVLVRGPCYGQGARPFVRSVVGTFGTFAEAETKFAKRIIDWPNASEVLYDLAGQVPFNAGKHRPGPKCREWQL